MLAELTALKELGYRGHVNFVDDNLIGNKKAVKPFLRSLIRWQDENGRPFDFSTEASMNLADDAELMALMAEAGFIRLLHRHRKPRRGGPPRNEEEAEPEA